MAAHILSYRETVTLIRDFLEVAFHTLLYLRGVYPPALFKEAQKYGVVVHQSRNPALTEYIGRVLECIDEEMQKGTIRRVILVIKELELDERPLERFVFDFEWLIKQHDLPMERDDFVPEKHGLARGDVEDLLRACLRKLNFSQSHLRKLPDKVSFAVLLEMKDDADPPESKAAREGRVPAEWIPAEQRHAAEDDGSRPGRGRAQDGTSIISPLESVRFGMINMDIRVEETMDKFEGDDLMSSGEYSGVEIHKMPDRKGKGRAV
ncbi:hypothetical protein JCM8097_001079 [Rhodosporidiobolus ruineniae]